MANVSVGLTEQCSIFPKSPKAELYTYVRSWRSVAWKVLGCQFIQEKHKKNKIKLEILKKNRELHSVKTNPLYLSNHRMSENT